MKHFNFQEIKEKGSCIDFAEQILNVTLTDGRCAAVWRNGTRETSVSVERDQWYDHAEKKGGGLIEFCAVSKFGGTDPTAIQQAQEFLGEWLGLQEVQLKRAPSVGKNRYNDLIADGYTEKARYDYIDLDGKLVYSVYRLEHPVKMKEFVQGTPGHWGISDITPILYNWKMIHDSDWCVIVEGEKDVETLKAEGIPATTNSGGSKKWRKEFSEHFTGKKVIILPDNDTAGEDHAKMVARDLFGKAESIRIVKCSKLPKGDVTDFFTKEGGNWEELSRMIAETPEFDLAELGPVDAAKEANRTPFRNYISEERESGRRKFVEKLPRQINELVKDLHTRLLGAPYKVGDLMFDQDRDSGKINYLYDAADLFSWIARKTQTIVDWSKIDGTVTKTEFFSALSSEAKEYQAISHIPDFPVRDDVFYSHEKIPAPSEGNKIFWDFVDFFSPADDESKSVLASFIMAPIFFFPGVDKPLFIIDSIDGQGSGKSTIPMIVAKLYGSNSGIGGEVIDTSLYDLEKNYDEVVKRVISAEGRNARIFRIDNVIGSLKSANLSRMVTMSSISGRASYGRGEESRPNNLTYVVTVNGATVDTDIASRAFYIMLKRPRMAVNWKENIFRYIDTHRMEIFADILDILKNHKIFSGCDPETRTPEFEYRVLQPACRTEEQYRKVFEFLRRKKGETNEDEEIARRLEEELFQNLNSGIVKPCLGMPPINPRTDRIFIRSAVLEHWFSGAIWLDRRKPVSVIKNLSQTGNLPTISPDISRYPHNPKKGQRRAHGVMWIPPECDSEKEVRIIDLIGRKVEEISEGSL